jgi:hypothetical protein
LRHAAVYLSGVVVDLCGEELRCWEAAVGGECVLWKEVQGCEVHDDEVASSVCVQARDLVVHAVHVVFYGFTRDLAVCQEGVVAQVVCADPDGVDGAVRLAGEEPCAVGAAVLGVCDEGREFVAGYVGERRVDGRK